MCDFHAFLDSVANALASKHIAPCNNNLINKKDKNMILSVSRRTDIPAFYSD